MISFIIVGKNEGWKITKCIQSILDTITHLNLTKYEIIYVDSKSTDNSIERAQKFKSVKVILITGKCNAAVARNTGALEAKAENLFFIDGDMEINKFFLSEVYSEKNGLKNEFVSGNWINKEYNDKWELQSESLAKKIKGEEVKEFITGGIFLIKKSLWKEQGGMKTKLKRSQDLDLGLRLAKKGCFLIRKKSIIALHHTIPYNDKKRMWKLLLSGANFYRIVLLRDNLFNSFQWKLFIRGNYSFILFYILIFLSFILTNPYVMILYILVIISRTYLRKEKSLRLYISNIFLFSIYEFMLLFAFFLFWPSSKKIQYKIV